MKLPGIIIGVVGSSRSAMRLSVVVTHPVIIITVITWCWRCFASRRALLIFPKDVQKELHVHGPIDYYKQGAGEPQEIGIS
jgi:hypothetical protein